MMDLIKTNRALLWRIIVVILLIVLGYVVTNYSFVSININSKDSGDISIFTAKSNGDPIFAGSSKGSESKRLLIHRGTVEIIARQNNNETRKPVRYRPLWSGDYNITLSPQLGVQKVGSGSLGCGTITDSVYYSYNCGGNSDVLAYNTDGDFPENKAVLDQARNTITQPEQYRSGILGVGQPDPEDDRVYAIYISINNTPTTQQVTLPSNGDFSSPDNLVVITDPTSRLSTEFGILNYKTGSVAVYASLSDKNPQSIQLSDRLKKDGLSTYACALQKQMIACVYGRPGTQDDLDTSKKGVVSGRFDTTLLIYSGGKRVSKRTLKEPGNIDSGSIILTKQNIIIHTSKNTVIVYGYSSDGKFTRSGEVHNVDSIFPTEKQGVILLRGDSAFSLEAGTLESRLLFSSLNIRISSFTSSYGNGIFTGFINNQRDGLLSAFVITDTVAKKPAVEDILPTTYTGLIQQLDYNNDTLYIKLGLTSYTSDSQTGEFTADQTEYKAAQNEVLRQLTSSGLIKLFKHVRFSY